MKRLKSDQFSYGNTYVRNVSVTPSDPKHYVALQGNDKWENVRYCLERQMGCFKFALPMKVTQNSYLTAVYQYSIIGVPPGTPVTSKTQIYGGDILIITRLPQPRHLHAYVPPKFWCDLGDVPTQDQQLLTSASPSEAHHQLDEQDQELTEEQKLEALCEQQEVLNTSGSAATFMPPVVIRILKQRIQHPTDYATLTTPHPLFVCQYCGNQGKHFHTLCPFIENDTRQNSNELVTKVRRILGIPKSRLRNATEEEVATGNYYLNENNEKVVVLDKREVQEEETKQAQKVDRGQFAPGPAITLLTRQDEYEQQLQFDFEDYVAEQDVLEKQREDKFYEQYPDLKKKKNQICTHYYRGMCHKGKLECEFMHSGDENYIAICQFYINDQCTEANCIFRHPPKHVFNNLCNAYKRGFCEKGSLCKYKHVKHLHPCDNPDLDAELCKAMVWALSTRKTKRQKK